jgi:probable HAF family extracellular repeat protein
MPSDPMFMSILGPNPSAAAVELLSSLQAIAPPSSPAGATIYALNGPSKLVTGSGNDAIYTGDNSDGIYAGAGNNFIYSGGGNDLILALNGNDTVFAGAGNDTVSVGDGNNNVYAADGNNTIIVGGGNDLIYAGHGNDYIRAGDGNNTVYAWDGNNTIITGSGDDLISVEEGNDVIIAGNGTNTIRAGAGNNIIESGSGDDFIMVAGGNDVVIAGDGTNTVYAGEGNNRVSTGSGDDSVYTGNGDDAIFTGAGNDYIYTGDGNNLVNAGTGNDTVRLGDGRDRVILEAGDGFVTINNFNSSVDKLRLGASLGSSVSFTTQGYDTVVKAGTDVLAILKNVIANQNVIENAPLYRYSATDLGSLSTNTANGNVLATSINDFGQVVGRYDSGAVFTNQSATGVVSTTNLVTKAFLWENGVQTALTSTGIKIGLSDDGAADGDAVTMLTARASKINDLGLITGTHDEVRQPVPLATDRGLRWGKNDTGDYQFTVNSVGGKETYYLDSSDTNQIAGRNINTVGTGTVNTPVAVENGITTILSVGSGASGTAFGINNSGTLVGVVSGSASGTDASAVWKKDSSGNYQLTNLGAFGFAQSTLRDVNESGHVIGSASSTSISVPFLIRDGQWTNLGSLGGNTGSVSGLNDFGQVVGTSQIASATNRPFVWSDGVIADLNNLITAPLTYNGAAVTLTSAPGINSFGDIVATGTYSYTAPGATTTSTGTRSFLLKAVA